MRYFPAFTDLQGRTCLVVGGGETAARKVRLLLKARADVLLVAHSVCPELAGLAEVGTIRHAAREFRAGDVLGKALVITGTDKAEVDEAVAEIARIANVPVNAVDRPWASTFITPAIVDRDPLVIGISSGGAGPVLARQIRERLEAMLPARIGRLATFAEGFRGAIAARLSPGPARLRFWQRVFDGPVATDVIAGDEDSAAARMAEMLAEVDEGGAETAGEVAIVGAGPGDPDLLTFKAMRYLQRADVVVHDRLVAPEIVDYARRDAERVFVGKARGCHAVTQDRINEILLDHARQGLKVVRLKGGDPFVFGRGGEERDFLAAHGIDTVVVPGITAAAGCAASAGIPLTDRRHASAVTFVTGHPCDADAPPDWASLARSKQTLAIYMGVGTATETTEQLMAHGLAPETPAAVVERGTMPDQRVLPTSLAGLADTVARHGVQPPALLVIGDVTSVLDRVQGGEAPEQAEHDAANGAPGERARVAA
jgi:uroporphyrin-III C-methyltransferase/precorrin-2 dehydrogenase/sirohydrochlorin ferrochelatase